MSLTCYAMKEFLSRIQRQVDKALESWNYIIGGKFAIPLCVEASVAVS